MIEWIDALGAIVRAAGLIAALQATGGAAFILLYARKLSEPHEYLNASVRRTALIAMFLVLLSQLLVAPRMSGTIFGLWDGSLQSLSWNSSSGAATIARAFGLFSIIAGSKFGWRGQVWLGFALVIVSFTVTGHTTSFEPGILSVEILLVHVAVVAFWFGALRPLWSILSDASATDVLTAFSKHATWLVPLIALAGIALACIVLPNLAALATPYGIALLGKVSAFALLMLLAALNKWRFVPAMERGDPNAFAKFARTAKVEYVIIVVVLCATATMTTLFSPE